MKCKEIEDVIPYISSGKIHAVRNTVYPGVEVRQPGKHASQSAGGDAGIFVTCAGVGWKSKPFTHDDIFIDIERKLWSLQEPTQSLVEHYYKLVVEDVEPDFTCPLMPGLDVTVLLHTLQVLSVIEHRRYPQHERAGGGRFLPLRFVIGIGFKHWSAGQAMQQQRQGRRGVEKLEYEYGTPHLTEKLLKHCLTT